MKLIGLLLVAMLLSSTPACAAARDDCTSIVTSAQKAAEKADWIIEGELVDIFRMHTPSRRLDLSIEKVKLLHEGQKSFWVRTAVVPVDACFPGGATTLQGKDASKLFGKRMRFFGTKLQADRGRRVFFMQPAEQPMPALPRSRKQYVTAKHVPITIKPGTDGWSRMRSTEGPFSVEMPGRVVDMTRMEDGEPAFMLRSADKHGTTYIAVFERAGPDSAMGGTFDTTLLKPDANTSIRVFKGAEAFSTVSKVPGPDGNRVAHGLWFRVPGGTYMLGIVAAKGHEAEALASRERFFNSLVFE